MTGETAEMEAKSPMSPETSEASQEAATDNGNGNANDGRFSGIVTEGRYSVFTYGTPEENRRNLLAIPKALETVAELSDALQDAALTAVGGMPDSAEVPEEVQETADKIFKAELADDGETAFRMAAARHGWSPPTPEVSLDPEEAIRLYGEIQALATLLTAAAKATNAAHSNIAKVKDAQREATAEATATAYRTAFGQSAIAPADADA